jgi:MacB-like periplasmic core domain
MDSLITETPPVISHTTYLRTFGIPLQRGRQFLPDEISGKQRAAIINETMSRQLWGDRDPIGAHIRMLSPEWITVVGISRDVRQSGVSSSPSAETVFARGCLSCRRSELVGCPAV